MAIATVGTTTTAEANGTTGVTNNVPTGVVDGNLLVWRWSGAGNASVPTTPTGWTVLQTGTTTVNGMAVWYRVAASEPASYTLGTLGASMRTTGTMSAYSGVDTGTPWDVATPAFSAGTTTTTCPAITPTTAGAWVLGFGDANVASGVTNTTFSSSNLTAIDGQVSSTQGAATNNVGAIGHFVWSSGAFTPAWTTSNASVRTLGGSAALRPAAAVAAVFPAGPARRVARPPTSTRQRRRVEVVPTQVVVTPPAAKVSDAGRHAVRGFAARRRRPAEVTPPPVDPNAYVGVYNDVITSIPSLIGRWKLDDRTGTVAVATVGSNGAYVTTPTLAVAGLVADGGTAVTTDGATSEITVPVGTNQKVIVFWSSHGAGGGAGIPIMRDSTSSAGTGWYIDISGVNPVVRADGTNHTVSTVTASTLRDGLRHFYVLQYDGTNVTLFIDGSQVDTWVKVGSFPSSATNWHFGKNGTAANFYGGTFDDIGGFNSLLSTGQVRNLWVSGITPAYPNESRRTSRRFTITVRRGRAAAVVPPQVVVTSPTGYVSDPRRAVRRFVATRRGRLVGVIPPQIPAPDRNRRRGLRGWVAVRDRSRVEVVPPQVVVAPPTYVPTTPAKHVLRGVPRRGRRAEVVPPQVVVAPPAYVPTVPAKHNLRGMQRRGRHVAVVPPQQAAPTAPPYVPVMPPRHALRGVPRRGRRADVPLAQTPAHRGQPRRPIRVLGRKVRRAVTVIAQSLVPTLTPEVTLTATVYDHVLTASTLNRTQTAGSQTHTLSSTTRANTLTASTLDRTIEET